MCEKSDDRVIISILQKPLSLEPEPFAVYAHHLGLTVEQVIIAIKQYISSGLIRRVAGIIKHNSAGFLYNAMVTFEVDDDQCDIAGKSLSSFSCISHCYRRTSYPDWPYNLYTMVHAHDKEEFDKHLTSIKNVFSFKSMAVLPTVKEFKKSVYQLPIADHNTR
jgi:DNA-binding Lrp family transcriptional regulator